MTLNRRLLWGISPLLIIFLAVGVYGIYLFTKLGGAIDVILRENYASVVAAQNMTEASERMDAGLLFALGGEEARGKDLFEQNVPIFEKNSNDEAHNITLPGEGDLEAKVQALHAKYLALADKFFALPATDPARRALYWDELYPTFLDVKATANRILVINQDNMVKANNDARKLSRDSSSCMAVALAAGFVVALVTIYHLSHSIVQPVQNLTESALATGRGEAGPACAGAVRRRGRKAGRGVQQHGGETARLSPEHDGADSPGATGHAKALCGLSPIPSSSFPRRWKSSFKTPRRTTLSSTWAATFCCWGRFIPILKRA